MKCKIGRDENALTFLFFIIHICLCPMGFPLLFFLALASLPWPAVSDLIPSTEFLYPNFTTSYYKSILSKGTFLKSPNGTYEAVMWSPENERTKYYLCIVHAGSRTVIWTANRDAPVSASGTVSLTTGGISIADADANVLWSTASLHAPQVSSLQLNDTGNLVLLGKSNVSVLWESFKHPTDTIVIGQVLYVGMSLTGARSAQDVSTGDNSLSLADADVILQWRNRTYSKLTMDSSVFRNLNGGADHLRLNETGLYLFSLEASVVAQLPLTPAAFRIAKLDHTGQLTVLSFSSGTNPQVDFALPDDTCRIPNVCGKLGLCTNGVQASPQCSCPANFHVTSHGTTDCVPVDAAYSLPRLCNNSTSNASNTVNSSSTLSYARLGYSVDYFSNDFTAPSKSGVNSSACQDLCSTDCSCFGVFYDNSSGSCFVLNSDVGSIFLRTTGENARLGYMKTVSVSSPASFGGDSDSDGRFPLAGLVLLPFTGLSLFILLGFLLWRRSRRPLLNKVKYGRSYSGSSDDLEAFTIPGLPVRFEYEELEAATDKFKTQIGSGGFGDVFKGTLPDKVVVAVKRMNSLSIQGKKDFCTEIAIIGNIHHVNLVKLRGFCAQDRHRLLVYEYMDRGSLDKSLFGSAPVLEWQERVEVALGAARGLAYLHSSCDRKIIHCDVKPENILLQHNFHAKLSDFGLSKLLSTEQSTLFTTMRGTRGYLAPEWLTNSAISDKTDVYSFGMVLLEMVSGRKNCPLRSRSHSLENSGSTGFGSSFSSRMSLTYFPLFALEMHEQGRYLELADPRLEGRVTGEEVGKFVRIALCCVHEEPALRPSMVNVVSMLEGEIPICEPRMESLNFLRFYGLRFAEASMVGGATSSTSPDDEAYSETNNRAGSNTLYSFISSQQISGPR